MKKTNRKKMVRLNTWLPIEIKEKIRLKAFKEKRTMTEVQVEALEKGLK